MPQLLKILPNEAISSFITRNAKTIFKLDYSFFQNLQVSGTKNVLEIWLWNLANQLFLSVRLMATQDPVLGGNEKMIGHFQEQKLVIILEIFFLNSHFFCEKSVSNEQSKSFLSLAGSTAFQKSAANEREYFQKIKGKTFYLSFQEDSGQFWKLKKTTYLLWTVTFELLQNNVHKGQ